MGIQARRTHTRLVPARAEKRTRKAAMPVSPVCRAWAAKSKRLALVKKMVNMMAEGYKVNVTKGLGTKKSL
jgi:hypothetical protein